MGPSMVGVARSQALAATGSTLVKGCILPAAQGWALPEAPWPLGGSGRRKRWLKAIPDEVVSSSRPIALWVPPQAPA